jgi:hypothetical protein
MSEEMSAVEALTDTEVLDLLLARAVWAGNQGAVAFLLEQGASPVAWPEEESPEYNYGIAIINRAVIRGNASIVRMLLDTGLIDVNGQYGDIGYRSVPVIFAAQYGSLEMVDLLLEYGALIDPVFEKFISLDWEGNYSTPLISAIKENRPGMVQHLLYRGASLDISLAEYPDIESSTLEKLLELGGDPQAITQSGLRLLEVANDLDSKHDALLIEKYIAQKEKTGLLCRVY